MSDHDSPRAQYVLGATVRLAPDDPTVHVEPPTVEVTVHREAAPPGEEGWLFFRDNCWHGELSDPDHVGELVADQLGVGVDAVDFRELRATRGYLEALRTAIAGDLAAFNDDSVDAVLHKYLGSSVHVVESGEL